MTHALNAKGVFPVPADTWERMWAGVRAAHPDGAALEREIRWPDPTPVAMPGPPRPPDATELAREDPAAQRDAVQAYLSALQYNHTGLCFFAVNKARPLHRLLELARDMEQAALPIKCLEAVLVGLHLTVPCKQLDRFPISFKSRYAGRHYRHIVLGLHHQGQFGAVGLSRRSTLMGKPLCFSLPDLIAEFHAAYAAVQHTLVRVRLGLPVPHDRHCPAPIVWRHLVLLLPRAPWPVCGAALEQYARELRTASFRPTPAVVPPPPAPSQQRRRSGVPAHTPARRFAPHTGPQSGTPRVAPRGSAAEMCTDLNSDVNDDDDDDGEQDDDGNDNDTRRRSPASGRVPARPANFVDIRI